MMYKFNGEHFYKAPPIHKRIRRWFFWIGGWEKANAKGWKLYLKIPYPKVTKKDKERLSNMTPTEQREYSKTLPRKFKKIWLGPTPISLFGHRITFHRFGIHVKLRDTYFCLSWDKRQGRKCYLSDNTTPWAAHVWFFGEPREVRDSAQTKEWQGYQ